MPLADYLGWDNPLTNFVGDNRNTLIGLGAGLMTGKDFGSGLSAGLHNAQSGRQADNAYAVAKQEEARRQQNINSTVDFMRRQGMNDLVAAVEGGMDVGQAWNEALRRTAPVTPNLTFSTQTIPGLDGNGNYALAQVGNNGSGTLTQFPEGFQPLNPFDLNAQRAAGSAIGKMQGGAEYNLPDVVARAEQAIGNLYGLLPEDANGNAVNNPGFEEEFGSTLFVPNSRLPVFDRTPRADFHARLDQAQGQAFLQGIEQMKGTGAISEAEGSKATQAIMRASTAQTRDGFISSIKEAIGILEQGVTRARQKAGAGPGASGNSADPLGLRG